MRGGNKAPPTTPITIKEEAFSLKSFKFFRPNPKMVGNMIENVNCSPMRQAKEIHPRCCEITRHIIILPAVKTANNLFGATKFIRYVPIILPESIINILNEK
jgi:hypothetical protein